MSILSALAVYPAHEALDAWGPQSLASTGKTVQQYLPSQQCLYKAVAISYNMFLKRHTSSLMLKQDAPIILEFLSFPNWGWNL